MDITTIKLWNSGYKKWAVRTEIPGKEPTVKYVPSNEVKDILAKLEKNCVQFTRTPRGADYIICTYLTFTHS